ncbi:hypothetical protein CYLTODRAFT_459439 [Cylindrobasidium torrendii FP15055 ss-10]|uniref:Uncharacterized protein n=1 Tax=Cylindrobasidium torrendii FP15055 ss-10 TaxID=1314674 RepID=A0A0D7AU69_9AGAR|nr:hypothetical protein CYLTODRAFT_459439 [Cylindrobasidium torrendii FP15055 ss-10]
MSRPDNPDIKASKKTVPAVQPTLLPGNTIGSLLTFTTFPPFATEDSPIVFSNVAPGDFGPTGPYSTLLTLFTVPSLTAITLAQNKLAEGTTHTSILGKLTMNKDTKIAIPFWFLQWWLDLRVAFNAKSIWTKAFNGLSGMSTKTSDALATRLGQLPWKTPLPTGFTQVPLDTVSTLAKFCIPPAWLRSSQLTQMATTLQLQLVASDITTSRVLVPDFFESLTQQYRRREVGKTSMHQEKTKLARSPMVTQCSPRSPQGNLW